MSRGGDTRFRKGQSGNPGGRPRQRRPHVSAFDIIFDQVLTVSQNGTARELTVDEALQLQTYQAALKGNRMAVRAVLKMIEKREVALAKRNPPPQRGARIEVESDSDNANEALRILGIAVDGHVPPGGGEGARTLKLAHWAAQAGISRPGGRALSDKDREDVARYALDPDKLRWPRGRQGKQGKQGKQG